MKKLLIVVFSIVLTAILLVGCSQPVEYSEKFEGIPIYPGMELVGSSEFEEYYEMFEFEGEFQQVIDYYLSEIDSKKWSIEESDLYWSEENTPKWVRRYILTDGEEEVSLLLDYFKTRNVNGVLHAKLNASQLKEGKCTANGQSNHWTTSLEYIIGNDQVIIQGFAEHLGDDPPQKVDTVFYIYEMNITPKPEYGVSRRSSSETASDMVLEDSMIEISASMDRDFPFDSYIEAINSAYIELSWEEQGEDKIERIEIIVADCVQ